MQSATSTNGERQLLDERAAAVVAEMIELGAAFTISRSGPSGELRWSWTPSPEIMRGAIRRFWTSVQDRGVPGFDNAMIEAIRRRETGAPT